MPFHLLLVRPSPALHRFRAQRGVLAVVTRLCWGATAGGSADLLPPTWALGHEEQGAAGWGGGADPYIPILQPWWGEGRGFPHGCGTAALQMLMSRAGSAPQRFGREEDRRCSMDPELIQPSISQSAVQSPGSGGALLTVSSPVPHAAHCLLTSRTRAPRGAACFRSRAVLEEHRPSEDSTDVMLCHQPRAPALHPAPKHRRNALREPPAYSNHPSFASCANRIATGARTTFHTLL